MKFQAIDETTCRTMGKPFEAKDIRAACSHLGYGHSSIDVQPGGLSALVWDDGEHIVTVYGEGS